MSPLQLEACSRELADDLLSSWEPRANFSSDPLEEALGGPVGAADAQNDLRLCDTSELSKDPLPSLWRWQMEKAHDEDGVDRVVLQRQPLSIDAGEADRI